MMVDPRSRAWVEVDPGALVRNARSYIERVGVPILPMVKANGYGLGAVPIARALRQVNPWGFGVASLDEAVELREAGIMEPVIVFMPLLPSMVEPMRRIAARPAIGDVAALEAWNAAGGGPFHLEIDTGMSRAGVRWDDGATLSDIRRLLLERNDWEGIFTHFHSAADDLRSMLDQWGLLLRTIDVIGRRPSLVHASNSAAGARSGPWRGDLARPGIHLYGGSVPGLATEPVARVKARVTAIRNLRKGESVSYDATWRAGRDTILATLAAGYADGLPRSLSGKGEVELGGTLVPIVGRVTMDQVMVDVTGLQVAVGDIATLWGGAVSLDRQAGNAGTISYELLTALGRRLPRIHLDG